MAFGLPTRCVARQRLLFLEARALRAPLLDDHRGKPNAAELDYGVDDRPSGDETPWPDSMDVGLIPGDVVASDSRAPDSSAPDSSVDLPRDTTAPDSSVDLPRDTTAPDSSVDSMVPDSAMDSVPPILDGCVPSCVTKLCGMDDGCGGLCESGCATTLTHGWSISIGAGTHDYGNAVVVDSSGNVTVVGDFYNTINCGGSDLTSAGSADFFVASFTSAGAHRWSKRFGGSSYDSGHALAVDGNGALTVVGSIGGTVDLGGGAFTMANSDGFAMSLSSTGAYRWSRQLGSDEGSDSAFGVETGPDGSVMIVGHFFDNVNMGGALLRGGGGQDVWLASFSESGAHNWSRAFPGSGNDYGRDVAVDSSGIVTITGTMEAAVDFGGGLLAFDKNRDVFIASYTPSGAHRWSKSYGGGGVDDGRSIAVDAEGNLSVTGLFESTAVFGGVALRSAGDFDIFVASYTSTGEHRWSRGMGAKTVDQGRFLTVDADGNVTVVGSFEGSVDFGAGSRASAGLEDIFVATYSPSGVHLWSQVFGAAGDDRGYGVTNAGQGKVALIGSFSNVVDFGGGGLTSTGFLDVFVAQLGP
ncbi:MAG: hypothetical protein JRH20_32630 [Deltaproteobacteria bacterium]|nr:hypothetical protein [Deltaproteobacteria bacterium]